MGHTTLAYYIVGAHAFFSHRTYRIPFFQARLLDNQECHDNQECANADTERYAFGKLSARCFQRPTFLGPMLFQLLWRYRPWEIDQGVCVGDIRRPTRGIRHRRQMIISHFSLFCSLYYDQVERGTGRKVEKPELFLLYKTGRRFHVLYS